MVTCGKLRPGNIFQTILLQTFRRKQFRGEKKKKNVTQFPFLPPIIHKYLQSYSTNWQTVNSHLPTSSHWNQLQVPSPPPHFVVGVGLIMGRNKEKRGIIRKRSLVALTFGTRKGRFLRKSAPLTDFSLHDPICQARCTHVLRVLGRHPGD